MQTLSQPPGHITRTANNTSAAQHTSAARTSRATPIRPASLLTLLGVLWLAAFPAAILAADQPSAIEGDARLTVTVGMEGFMKQVVLPGSELTIREVDPRRTPIVLRIDRVYPHGDALRYDLTYSGLEPGSHDITDYFVRRDGSSTDDLPALPVTVDSVLPSGEVRPSSPPDGFLTRVGGYGNAIMLAGVAWVLGLFAILFLGRTNEAAEESTAADTTVSEVDQIRRLIDQARHSGELTSEQKAQLDMKVLNFWRARRHMDDAPVSKALEQLKADEQAGPLLSGLERWFYSHTAPQPDEIHDMLDQMKQHSQAAPASAVPAGGAP